MSDYMLINPNEGYNWWNYRTEKYDSLIAFPDDNAILDYMPQNPAAFNMYRMLRNNFRMSVADAMVYVLESCLRIPHTVELPEPYVHD